MPSNRFIWGVLLAAGFASASGVIASPTTLAEKDFAIEKSGVISSTKQKTTLINTTKKRYLVQLESPAIANYQGEFAGLAAAKRAPSGKLMMSAASSRSYANHLSAQQQTFIHQLASKAPGLEIQKQFSLTFNGVVVSGQLEQAALAGLPGVKAVYPEKMFHASMDSSLAQINASKAWQRLEGRTEAGKGIKVAIIDSGIRPENPMFSDEGFTAPASLPSDDYCHTTDASFCNNKLIVARWIQPNFPVDANEHLNPLGYNGHGTHVAGTSVGNPVSVNFNDIDMELSGVAPGAYLMVYKTLYFQGLTSSATNIMLVEALEAAVADGADVINNSWGGGPGADPAFSPYKQAFEAAEASGVVVVSAAGNDGDNGEQTIGCPGCVESGITVANLQTGRMFSNRLSIDTLGDYGSLEGNSSVQLADLTDALSAPLNAAALIDDANVTGCEPFAEASFSGQIALISRGECAFSLKAQHAQEAGAVALVVYNNGPGYTSMNMSDATLPAIMINQTDGNEILSALHDGLLAATIDRSRSVYVAPELADVMNSSSSRGPNGDANILKPDLAAPGTQILSAASPEQDGGAFGLKTGTSMASPHVAGAAALLRAIHPEWTPADVKAALTSTANQQVKDDDITSPATPFDMGAGRIDLELAGDAALSFDTVSVASPVCVGSCVFQRSMKSLSDTSIDWQASVEFDSPGVEASLSATDITLAAGEQADFSLSINTDYAEKDSWHFGTLTWRDLSGNAPAAHMAIAVYAGSSDAPGTLVTSSAELNSGETVEGFTQVINTDIKDPVTLTLRLPKELAFAGQPQLHVSGAQQMGYEADLDKGLVTWVGRLQLPAISLKPVAGSAFSLSSLDSSLNLCEGETNCDDKLFAINIPTVTFSGKEYQQILVSTNGYVELASSAGLNPRNRELPDALLSNPILAPFLTDLDLTEGVGGGELLLNILGDDSSSYLIIEWHQAQLWNDSEEKTYSFQIWFNLTTGDVEYNYIALDRLPDSPLTVGIQNSHGIVGDTIFYNGEGTAPVTGSGLLADITPSGQVAFSYELAANSMQLPLQSAVTDEEKPLTLEVLGKDSSSLSVINAVLSSRGRNDLHAQSLVKVTQSDSFGNIELLKQPEHGELIIGSEGKLVYTPEKDYFGADSFTFKATENGTKITANGRVNLKVNNINDLPQLKVTGTTANTTSARGADTGLSLSTEGKTGVTLSAADSTDVDGDELTYEWKQLAGPAVNITSNTASIQFTAPNQDTNLVFQVTVSDGKSSVTSPEERVAVSSVGGSGGGGAFGLALILLPLIAVRRRMH